MVYEPASELNDIINEAKKLAEDESGWYPSNQYLWIDGVKYWFGSNGYWE